MASWLLIDKMLGGKAPKEEAAAPMPVAPAAQADPNETFRNLLGKGPLDEVGQQSEHVRERVGHLSMRLEDLKTLAEDFGQIISPLNDFIVQHTHTRAKLLESEALLSRDRDLLAGTRAELNDVQAQAARMSGDLAAALAELRFREDSLREQEGVITQMRLKADDQDALLATLDKQLASDSERARLLTADNQALRQEIDGLDGNRVRSDAELAELRGHFNVAQAEVARLQQLAETLTQRIAGFKNQIVELEPQVQTGRQEIADLQAKLASERAARQKMETSREIERSAQDGEIASLRMKIDGLGAQMSLTEKMLGGARDQIRDKTEALRLAEKTIKDTVADKIAAERRVDQVQDANVRMSNQLADAQRLNGDLKDRVDMLNKAVVAKEAGLESTARKMASLESQLDQLNARLEQDRAAYENSNRRLIEELQSEKAERSLAQGALDIARNSRTKLLTQYTALKRQQGGRATEPAEIDLDERMDIPDNVRIFKSPDRTE